MAPPSSYVFVAIAIAVAATLAHPAEAGKVAECDPFSWKSGLATFDPASDAPVVVDFVPPRFMTAELYQEEGTLVARMRGLLPSEYVDTVTGLTGAEFAKYVGHAHIGACEYFDPETENIGVNAGAHWNFNTSLAYGIRENEIWYGGEASALDWINYTSPVKEWTLPGAQGDVPSVDISDEQPAGSKGKQGNVPGSALLHLVNSDGSTGEAWSCCTFEYDQAFCESIGGCVVYNKAIDEFSVTSFIASTV